MNEPTAIAAVRERWHRVEALYHSALSIDVAEREDWLVRECGDESIRQDVMSLIASADSEDSFLEEPALSFGLTLINEENDSLIGTHVDRYRIRELLGRGGMGEVYLAEDLRLGRLVALKVLPSSITDNRERVRRFQREAKAASAISHPNVAHIYEIGETDGRHYITMEYVKGATLRQLIRKGPLSVPQAVDVAIQVGNALAAAHRARVIHRDIKPENIILADDGYVKVLDFGLAKLVEDSELDSRLQTQSISSIHTAPELFMGTSHYMSPEQVRRQPPDQRTDLWSLGVVIYEMLTWRRPFQAQSFSEVIIAIIEKSPVFSETERDRISTPLRVIIEKALSKELEQRYQTAQELLADLHKIQQAPDRGFTSAATHPNNHESMPTVPDFVRPNTIAERLDTVKEEEAEQRPRFTYPTGRTSLLFIGAFIMAVAAYFGLPRLKPALLAARPLNLRFERLNLSGVIDDITLSPDGKYVAAIVRSEGKSVIHVSELATGSDLPVTPPRAEGYSGLSFSPDSTYVYYLEDQTYSATLNRVSKFGGGQRKIADKVSTRASFSPDGTQMVFARVNKIGEPADLIIAAPDGESQRVLAKRTIGDSAFFFSDRDGPGPVWSPDGKSIACATHGTDRATPSANIELLDPQTGANRRITPKPWLDVSRLTWLADGSGLVAAAKDTEKSPWQLQMLSLPGGETRAVTNDPNNYTAITGAADSTSFVTINAEEESNVWLVDFTGQSVPRKINSQNGISEVFWNPNGTLTFVARDATNSHLWTGNSNGTSLRQLTFDKADQFNPVVSQDQRYIFFVSGSASGTSIFQSDADGSNAKRLTNGPSDTMPSIAPDGSWLAYRTAQGIRKLSLNDGTVTSLWDKQSFSPAISPNGQMLSFFTSDQADSKKWDLMVLDARTASAVARFELPEGTDPFGTLRWTPTGDALTYISSAGGAANVWLQPIKGGQPRQLTDFKEAELYSFAWSPDGKKIACVRHVKVFVPMLVRLF